MKKSISVVNFYKFVQLDSLDAIQSQLQQTCAALGLRGTILLSCEGINGSLGGPDAAIVEAENHIKLIPQFADLVFKKSYGTTVPFSRLKVRIKDSILIFDEKTKFKVEDFQSTKRLSPSEWQETLSNKSEEFILLDTRNDYEIAYGAFEGAEQLNIEHFQDFQDRFLETYKGKEDKKFLMYCTGGIRCEKVTAFAEKNGFNNCYQLDGGIVGYFQEQGKRHWNGSCFVFDFRWAINADLQESGEGHYLEDGFRGTVHQVPEKLLQERDRAWPVNAESNP